MTVPDNERKNKLAKYIGSNIFQYRKKINKGRTYREK